MCSIICSDKVLNVINSTRCYSESRNRNKLHILYIVGQHNSGFTG